AGNRPGGAAGPDLQRAGVDGRAAGVGVGPGQGQGAGPELGQGAGAGDDPAEGDVVGPVEGEGGVVDDVAGDGPGGPAGPDLQRAGADRRAADESVGPG